ncbi:MAG: hypothetical protein IJY71_06195 [Clostridia bacterium]|nr:hypothetical protein [Clostridia bacterium]MBQ9129254.1 hypothetical protein [Clostridia bacterium]
MKKQSIYKFFYLVAALLVLGFLIRFGVDVFLYDTYLTSAPLYLFALVRAFAFLLPAALVFLVGLLLKKKLK